MAKTKVKKRKDSVKKSKEKIAGKVTHYFSKIKVAIIKLSAPIKQGENIRIIGGENTDFKQKVSSMQFNHKEINKAQKGKIIGLKVSKKVREDYKVYKI